MLELHHQQYFSAESEINNNDSRNYKYIITKQALQAATGSKKDKPGKNAISLPSKYFG